MAVSVFDLFSIGIGPSSSHTVGPMNAANQFIDDLLIMNHLRHVERVRVDLYGSLALTGEGHGTDKAILLGLEAAKSNEIDPNDVKARLNKIRKKESLFLAAKKPIAFLESRDLIYRKNIFLPEHSNAMRMTAYDGSENVIYKRTYYSVGGGFILDEDSIKGEKQKKKKSGKPLPFPYETAGELLAHCEREKCSLVELVWKNERASRSRDEIEHGLLDLWHVMEGCISRGCKEEGVLPGGLGVMRRASGIYRELSTKGVGFIHDPSQVMDWISLYALAVNEENAAGGRIVTAPTNGAAGIIPAVIQYQQNFIQGASESDIIPFLLVAGAVGFLYKKGASLSAAEVGCQGEVGVACSMAAAGLAAVMGGTNGQIENAAEIGMEHNLGLTCDPVAGLVQIPCIERNTMGAIKAVNAARLALKGDGIHQISLDKVIATMKQTGKDMRSIYKETSQGGLAVNVIEC
ncbi:L-serine dehydratase [Chlamydiales bacterium SCGC AG-110-M15]|nr:L-serine dehydratase [Chlamydiales bacterium SCGC AG-110-M15]